jgi:hypothetical protein
MLLRLREGQLVISGDIKGMFNQVRVCPDDKHTLHTQASWQLMPENFVQPVKKTLK